MDNKDKIVAFIESKRKSTKRNVFFKWKDEILFMKEKGATLQIILEYLFQEDEYIKKEYSSETRIKTAKNMLSNFIRKNDININDNNKNEKKEIKKKLTNSSNNEKEVKTSDLRGSNAKNSSNENNKVEIELIDGSKKIVSKNYLENYAICNENSGLKNDFIEKNYIVVPNKYNKKNFNFKEVIDSFINKNLLIENQLIIHINIDVDNKFYIYRYHNEGIKLLDKFIPSGLSHLEDYLDNGKKIFWDKYLLG